MCTCQKFYASRGAKAAEPCHAVLEKAWLASWQRILLHSRETMELGWNWELMRLTFSTM